MASFTPTEEQQMLVEAVHRYAETDVRKVAHEADETGAIPPRLVETGWEIGLIPAAIPEAYGGLGEREALTGALAVEEMAWGDLAVALKVMAPALFAYPVFMFGTEQQQADLLPPFAEAYLPMTAAWVEPAILFDPEAMQTTATADNGGYVISGTKAAVPLAAEAEKLLVYARDAASGEIGAYIVDRGADGLSIGQREKLMGIHGLDTYALSLSSVKVEKTCKLGEDTGINFSLLRSYSQVALAAMAVGVARASFEYARDYAKERVQFGVPIASKQSIAFMLAEMAIEVDAARLMVWEAAWKLDQGQDASAEAYLAKEYAAKAALYVTDCGVQTLGGHGFIREHPVERWLRNARGFATFDGLAMI